MTDSSLKAVLFDIDGTLVDSNYLHVEAWDRAFAEVGHPVNAWRIHRSIGMDSSKLLESLLGDDAERLGDAAKARNSEIYAGMTDRLRSFDGAQDLLHAIDGLGLQVVLATSAPPEELESLRAVLDIEDAISEITSASDVETAKPSPDIVQVALKKAGVDADEAVFVGDAVWDITAAGAAGVRAIGVRSGGVSAQELLEAGAVAVYDDARDLLNHLDESPIAS
jgi:HAD superfamily hydrolase (TIGR01509 family)